MLVAVHDGARPLVSEAVITEAVTTAAEYGAAAPVVPVKDSIKRIKDGNIAADVARDTLAAVQTPQVFRKDLLRRALTSAAERGYSFTVTARLSNRSAPSSRRPRQLPEH